MSKASAVKLIDVPIVKLTPARKRKVSKKAYAKLMANIKAVGLIEPLCVFEEGDQYTILDGYIRYQVLLDLGVQTVPCQVLPTRDFYTPNRQVNNLSSKEEVRMLRKALEKVDEKTVAAAFGMTSLRSRLNTTMYRELHPRVVSAIEEGKLYQSTGKELTFVQPKRQAEILKLMEKAGDWSLAFAKAQILKTPPQLRSGKKKRKDNPWDQSAKKKRALVQKLQEVEQHFDFYSGLYRQYVGDLLKLAVYARQILTRAKLRKHLAEKYPDALKLFEGVVEESEGKVAV